MKLSDISRMAGALLWLGLALFIGHELDAVARHEWRLLPGFAWLEDDAGRDVFVLLHIPLLAVIFWIMTHPVAGIRNRGRATIAGLLVVHGVLHFALSGHELYEFEGIVAALTIYGAAFAGAIYFALQAIAPK